jgi:hypothetical protein
MKKRLVGSVALMLVLAFFLVFQISTAIAADIDPVVGTYDKGVYTNNAPAFTVQFPSDWFTAPTEGSELFHILSPHPWKVPVATLSILDRPEDAPELGTDAAAEAYLAGLKEAQPGSSRHKILKKEMVTLKDGTKAMTMVITWRLAETTLLVSAVITAYKGDKVVSITNTTVPAEGTSSDDLIKMLLTLKFKES